MAPERRGAGRGVAAVSEGRSLAAGLVAVSLVSVNLRTAVIVVSPLLSRIQTSLRLSSAVAGLLTSVPALCFGAFAVAAPALARRLGLERALASGLALLTGGMAVRGLPGLAPLFLGTLLAGVGAAIGNVLLPALVKRDYPGRIGLMTGSYTMVLTSGVALAAAFAVPLADALGGWRPALAVWAAPALLGLLTFTALEGRRASPSFEEALAVPPELWRQWRPWALTIFMGVQSFTFYGAVAFMPTVFEAHGVSASRAGLLLALNGVVSIPVSLAAPLFAGRVADQRLIAVAATLLTALALAGLAYAPRLAPLACALVLGVGTGTAFSLSLTLIGLRSGDGATAARLSAMMQTYGYLFAASGPFLVGLLHDAIGGWAGPLTLLLAMQVPQLVAALSAARPGVINLRR